MEEKEWVEAPAGLSVIASYEVKFEVDGVIYTTRYWMRSNFPGMREQMAPQAVRDRLEVQYAEMGRNLISVALLSEQLLEAPPMSDLARERVEAIKATPLMERIAARKAKERP